MDVKKGRFELEARENIIGIIIVVGVFLLTAFLMPTISQNRVFRKMQNVKTDLSNISTVIKNYFETNERLPQSLNELSLNKNIIKDKFSKKGESYIYRIEKDEWLLYSRGPNGEDNNGDILYNYKNGLTSPCICSL